VSASEWTIPPAVAGGDEAAHEELEAIEIALLLEAVYRRYGFDFREYAPASLKRRLWRRMNTEGLSTLTQLHDRLLHDPPCMERLLLDLSINVTAMFRDPSFYVAFRREIVPALRTYPFTRIWCAGCSTGEEVYSLAIVLQEEGLYDRTRIYATDINEQVLEAARTGVFPLGKMKEYAQNYKRSGGTAELSDYYVAAYGGARFSRTLTENVVFAQHNLVSDGVFNEFNVIVCRNVMIYFDKALQNRVHQLFYNSLDVFGVLALGHKESVAFTRLAGSYEVVDAAERIYRKIT
jgi:chemotaxis protein methyltransferase CheR